MKRSKIIYRTLSVYPLYKYFFLRIAAFVFAMVCFYNYNENPIVTTIAGIFFLYAFLIIGDDELVVYTDRLKYSSNSILSLFRKKRQYLFSDIKAFNVSGDYGLKMDVFTDNVPISILDPDNLIEITLFDGRTDRIINHIYIDKLKRASNIINRHIQSPKRINISIVN